MSVDGDRLLALLPAVHRLRDDELARSLNLPRGPLAELLDLIGELVAVLEEDVDQLYADQFIETCADWVVPYIGDLVGYVPVRVGDASAVSRAEVADAIRARRLKGTALGLQTTAHDVTGADVAVVEYFRRLALTQPLNRQRHAVGLADLRPARGTADERGPFAPFARGVEVRSMAAGGRWNLRNVGVFVWDWRAQRRINADPMPVDDRRFLLDPRGLDVPILLDPLMPHDRLATEADLRRALDRRSAARDPALVAQAFALTLDGQPLAAPTICDLSDLGPDPETSEWAHAPAAGVALDPALGRLAFAVPPAGELRVSYSHAGSGLIGGGEYPRPDEAPAADARRVGVPADAPTLAKAVASPPAGRDLIVELTGARRLAAAGLPAKLAIPAGRTWHIRSENEAQAVLLLDQPLTITGGEGSALVLDGLCIAGAALEVPARKGTAANRLGSLELRDCTLLPGLSLDRRGAPRAPGSPSLRVDAPDTAVTLRRCVSGPVLLHPLASLRARDSVIDAGDAALPAIGAAADPAGPAGTIRTFNVTVRGTAQATLIGLASNTLFLGGLVATQRQTGLVRFSWLAAASRTPRRYRCVEGPTPAPPFESWQAGHPFYARLTARCPDAIARGADDGGEIGAFHLAHAPARAQALAVRLQESLPLGLDAGVFRVRAV